MSYFAGYFPTHGLKVGWFANRRTATQTFTGNNNGTPPVWVEWFRSSEYETARTLKGLGWRGTADEFRAELQSAYTAPALKESSW
jgi:hypothetical protein